MVGCEGHCEAAKGLHKTKGIMFEIVRMAKVRSFEVMC